MTNPRISRAVSNFVLFCGRLYIPLMVVFGVAITIPISVRYFFKATGLLYETAGPCVDSKESRKTNRMIRGNNSRRQLALRNSPKRRQRNALFLVGIRWSVNMPTERHANIRGPKNGETIRCLYGHLIM